MKPPIFNPDWPADVQAVYRHDMQEIWDPNIARHIWNQYHNQLDLYLSLAAGAGKLDVLDVGCAQATLALLLAERGHTVWAMDIRQQFLDYAATRYECGDVRFICGNAMETELDKQFDLIFANQIVEHLVYPLEFLQRLTKWLKPGGRLVMTTPNGEYIKNPLPSYSELGDLSQYANRQFTADADGHFFAYRCEELKAIFETAGLRDIEARCFETPFVSGHLKVRHTHSLVPRPILKLLDRTTLLLPKVGVRLAHQMMVTGSLAS
jgi:2-polyprenyl-6-hydroxyphenyl methylase/3-demethylubiquinone-9 3-methyltransferase